MGLESRDKGVTVQLGPNAGALGRVSSSAYHRSLTLTNHNPVSHSRS